MSETFWHFSEILHNGWWVFSIGYSETTKNEPNLSKFLWYSFTMVEEKFWILISESTENEGHSSIFLWNSFTMVKEKFKFSYPEPTQNEQNSLISLWNYFPIVKENLAFWFQKALRINEIPPPSSFWEILDLIKYHGRHLWKRKLEDFLVFVWFFQLFPDFLSSLIALAQCF